MSSRHQDNQPQHKPERAGSPEVSALLGDGVSSKKLSVPEFGELLLKHAMVKIGEPVSWHGVGDDTTGERTYTGFGSGAALAACSIDEYRSELLKPARLSKAKGQTFAGLIQYIARQMFAKHPDCVGFCCLKLNARMKKRPASSSAPWDPSSSPQPREVEMPLRGARVVGFEFGERGRVELTLPVELFSTPFDDKAIPFAERSVHYGHTGSWDEVVQGGLGRSPVAEIQDGRTFLSFREGLERGSDESLRLKQPMLFVGRLCRGSTSAIYCDIILLTVNLDRDETIDFIGPQISTEEISKELRWQLWSEHACRWAELPANVIDLPLYGVVPKGGMPESNKEKTQRAFGKAAQAAAEPSESLSSLADRVLPTISDKDLEALEWHINAARVNTPKDKAWFVATIKEFLDVFSLRLRVEGAELARLRLASGYTIQLVLSDGSTRPFRDTPIRVVRIPRSFVGRYASAEFTKTL